MVMHLAPDLPIGRPSFELSEDQLATVVDLLCAGTAEARKSVTPGMLEVPITTRIRKAMLRVKKALGLTNLEIGGEFELLDPTTTDSEVEGRIDITLKFLHQFGDEEAYLAVECKRVAAGDASLNRRYVTEGVDRFVTGQYAQGHHWGMMLGYVLELPISPVVDEINRRLANTYGAAAALETISAHADALSMHRGALAQGAVGHLIRLLHIFVDMTAAKTTAVPAPQ
jgi:hypothetical protein